jgi:hypothetical protein
MKNKLAEVLCVAFLMVATVLFLAQVLLGNSHGIPWDCISYFYPALFYSTESLKRLTFPLWNPHIFAGFPAAADPQVGLFYPPNLLLCLFSAKGFLTYKLVEIQLALHYFLAGLFMFVFLKSLRLTRFAALFGAVVYMFSGYLAAHAQHFTTILAAAWIPIIFYYSKNCLLKTGYLNAVKAGTMLGIQILAGHPQTSVYTLAGVFAYFGWTLSIRSCEIGSLRAFLPSIWKLVVLTAVCIGLSAVLILPAKELSKYSIRNVTADYESVQLGGMHPHALVSLILPNFFGGLFNSVNWHQRQLTETHYYLGVLPLLLVVVSIRFIRKKNLFWLVGGLVFLLLALADHLIWPRLFYAVAPKLNLFARHINFFVITNFCLAVLAAYGIDLVRYRSLAERVMQLNQKFMLASSLFVLVAIIFFGLLAIATPEYEPRLNWILTNLIILILFLYLSCGLISMAATKRVPSPILKVLVLSFVLLDLFTFNSHQRFNSQRFDPGKYLTPNSLDSSPVIPQFLARDKGIDYRVAPIAIGAVYNYGSVVGFQDIFGYNPVALKSYTSYLSRFAGTVDYQPRFDVAPNLNSNLLDLLSVKYLIMNKLFVETMKVSVPSERYESKYDNGWWRIYLNKRFLPRAYVSRKALVFPDEESMFQFVDGPFFSPRDHVLVAASDAARIPLSLQAKNTYVWTEGEGYIEKSSAGGIAQLPTASGKQCLGYSWGGHRNDFAVYSFNLATDYEAAALAVRYASAGRKKATVGMLLDKVRPGFTPLELVPTGGWGVRFDEWQYAKVTLGRVSAGQHDLKLVCNTESPINLDGFWLYDEADSCPASIASLEDTKIIESSGNKVAVEVTMRSPGFLVLSDAYYPGWMVYVDGQKGVLLKANSIFRAVSLEQGKHLVEFKYAPRSFYRGLAITLSTLVLVSVFWLRQKHPKNKTQNNRKQSRSLC